jgi:hypothetical protein
VLIDVTPVAPSFWNSPQSRGLQEYQDLRNKLLPGKMDAAFGGHLQASAPWVQQLLETPVAELRAADREGANGPIMAELVARVSKAVTQTPGAERTVQALTERGIQAAVRPYVQYVVQQMVQREPAAVTSEEDPAQASYVTRGADARALAWLDQDRSAKLQRAAAVQALAAQLASRVLGRRAPVVVGEPEVVGDQATDRVPPAPVGLDPRTSDEKVAEHFGVAVQRAARLYANTVFAGLATPAPAAAPAAAGVPAVAQGPGLQARTRAVTPETASGATSAAMTAVMLGRPDFSWRQAIDTLVAVQKNIRRPAEDQALRDLFFDPNLERRALQEGIGGKFATIQANAITKFYQSARQTLPEARRLLLEAYDTELAAHAKQLGLTKEEYAKRLIDYRAEKSQDDSPFTARGSGSDQNPTTSTPEDGGTK